MSLLTTRDFDLASVSLFMYYWAIRLPSYFSTLCFTSFTEGNLSRETYNINAID